MPFQNMGHLNEISCFSKQSCPSSSARLYAHKWHGSYATPRECSLLELQNKANQNLKFLANKYPDLFPHAQLRCRELTNTGPAASQNQLREQLFILPVMT